MAAAVSPAVTIFALRGNAVQNAVHWSARPPHNLPLERTAAAVYFTCGRASRVRRRGRSTALRLCLGGAGYVGTMRRFFNVLTIASLLLSLAVAGWWLRSRSTWETMYFRTGSWLWNIDSALGKLTVGYYRNWPGAPRHHYRVSEPDPYKSVTPVFAWFPGTGAKRVEWAKGPFEGAYGTACLVLRADGSVDWDMPALPVLRGLATAKLSPPIPFASITLPHWFLVALFALPPIIKTGAMVVRSVKRWLRRSHGLCSDCGYDIRESPARCPECGAATLAPPAVRPRHNPPTMKPSSRQA
jgi:hypothetical protein